ncbi:PREDICTED: uncharacterized protein LOC106857961 [Sturnus vulgaris]|uniref:uncharacterized protein LOC106857961 n=1 Tax=Sturnus vulgaris TaxID=9172 RepID=UPI00071A31EA|nr:PREDICTED: uncharacterized protein LOC106857961 [Sturnus vulgaris]
MLRNKSTSSTTAQNVTKRRRTKHKATVSVSMQTATEEKKARSAISISTQTITEPEQPRPVAVAPVQKKKSKSKSVHIVTDEDVAGPSHPAEETEPEIITRSLSLGELRDLQREFTRQTNESILTWLLRIWDAAANDTILDGSEARQLGSLSRDVVIDQGTGRTQETLSLWQRLLTSVKDRYLCKEDLQVHQGKWNTIEQGIRFLRELAVLEIIFSEDERFPKSPDCVRCTSQMWFEIRTAWTRDRGVQYTWNRLPQRWKHSPTTCHGLIQAALEKGEAPEHLQYIDDIIVWGSTAGEVFEKGEKIIQILLKAGFAIKQSKVKGPAQEIQFLGVKWQDGRHQIPTEVINKITAMSPPTNKKETQASLGVIGFWRMHIPEYSQIVSPLYLVNRKRNDFHWGPEQQEALTGNGKLQYGAPHDKLHKLPRDKVDRVRSQS